MLGISRIAFAVQEMFRKYSRSSMKCSQMRLRGIITEMFTEEFVTLGTSRSARSSRKHYVGAGLVFDFSYLLFAKGPILFDQDEKVLLKTLPEVQRTHKLTP